MKTKRKLLSLALTLLFVFAAQMEARAQEDGPYPVYVYLIVNGGKIEDAATQKFRVGSSQPVNLSSATTTSQYYVLTFDPGYTVTLSTQYAGGAAGKLFREGKYKLNSTGVLSASLKVEKIFSDDRVTLFSGRDHTGMAFDYGIGSYRRVKARFRKLAAITRSLRFMFPQAFGFASATVKNPKAATDASYLKAKAAI